MNFRWNATLFSERGQNFFMSLGRGWSKLSIKVIIASFPFRRFRSLPLILLFWYKSSRLKELEMNRNVFHNVFTKSRKVFRFCVLTGTFLAYPIKSIIRARKQLCSGSDVGILPGRNVLALRKVQLYLVYECNHLLSNKKM